MKTTGLRFPGGRTVYRLKRTNSITYTEKCKNNY